MKIAVCVLGLFALLASGCREASVQTHEEAENTSPMGPGRAILAAEPGRGFQLAPAAIQTLGVKWVPLESGPPFSIPSSGLVFHQAEIGVYRAAEDWFQLIPVRVLRTSTETAQIASEVLRPGDLIVIAGAAFLRVAELEVFGEAPSGHTH